ncbi:MAG: IS200/IS605 family transposase [Oligoflexales bacterium]|nr:IS200/IS605 family transposase [Oligoflexales bacterium]
MSRSVNVKEMEVMLDHYHIFVSFPPKIAPSNIVLCLKGITARKIFMEFAKIKRKLWGGPLWNPSFYIGVCSAGLTSSL